MALFGYHSLGGFLMHCWYTILHYVIVIYTFIYLLPNYAEKHKIRYTKISDTKVLDKHLLFSECFEALEDLKRSLFFVSFYG